MPPHMTQAAIDGLCLPSNKVVFIRVLIKNLQLQLLAGGFVDDKLTRGEMFLRQTNLRLNLHYVVQVTQFISVSV